MEKQLTQKKRRELKITISACLILMVIAVALMIRGFSNSVENMVSIETVRASHDIPAGTVLTYDDTTFGYDYLTSKEDAAQYLTAENYKEYTDGSYVLNADIARGEDILITALQKQNIDSE